jgi:hypothetical protein
VPPDPPPVETLLADLGAPGVECHGAQPPMLAGSMIAAAPVRVRAVGIRPPERSLERLIVLLAMG